MVQIIRKSEQYNDVIFGGRFLANKPVFNGKSSVKPYSNLYYWSHAYINEDCEFGLHPHQGFEIMTFILAGENKHFDTKTKVWTPLRAGDFQIIQSNSGIQHQEKISKGSRAFQIWFDPNYDKALTLNPSYVDYHSEDFPAIVENGVQTIHYVGNGSKAEALTPGISIRKMIFEQPSEFQLDLSSNSSYTFYVLDGKGLIENNEILPDDAIRVTNSDKIELRFQGELFCIETPSLLDYTQVWKR